MKAKTLSILILLTVAMAVPMVMAKKNGTRIQDGVLTYSAGRYLEGELLKVGYDVFGYNYQAHIFKGYYCNYYLNVLDLPPYEGDDSTYYQRLVDEGYFGTAADAEAYMTSTVNWLWQYRNIWLVMKWNDAWLSNMDCVGDGSLDRHYGYASYIGSGAWETNHMWGTNTDGAKWNYYVKIVAVPADATLDSGIWYDSEGVEIGTSIWGSFAIIFQVSNDPSVPEHGVLYNPPSPTGFGYYKP